MASDLAAAAHRRFLLRLVDAVVFVDGYDLSEGSGAIPRSWVADFADALRTAGAPVMLVLGCRHQRLWSERLEHDPERNHRALELGLFDGSPSIEIHTLDELSDRARVLTLLHHRVPQEQIRQLAEISRGHPLRSTCWACCSAPGAATRRAPASCSR